MQERACYALDTFCEGLELEELGPYMPQVSAHDMPCSPGDMPWNPGDTPLQPGRGCTAGQLALTWFQVSRARIRLIPKSTDPNPSP